MKVTLKELVELLGMKKKHRCREVIIRTYEVA